MSLNSDDDETDAEYVPDKEVFEDESENGTKLRSSTLGSRRSKTWDYFDVDDSTGVGCCRFCGKEVPYRSVAELKTHIDSDHARVEELESGDGDGNLNSTTGRKKLSSKIWKYFDVHDAEAKVAKCKTCGKHLLYHTLNNLNKHLKRSHATLDPGLPLIGPDHSTTVKKEPQRKKYKLKAGPRNERVNRSKVWNYYTIVDPDAKVAKCTLCHRKFAYTYLTNLKKHLNRKHPGKLDAAASSDEEGEEMDDDDQTTPVWAYFKSLDKTLKIASCLVCKMRTEYNTDEELIRHLNRKHPYIDLDSIRKKTKKLMITGNGDIYEIDDSVAKLEPPATPDDSDDWPTHRDEVDALHASETYLDESIFDESPYIPAAKRRKSPRSTQHTTQEDSLDMFGKYMVSLLRNLPKKKADQLQVEFVKQIMEANISNDESSRYNAQVLNNSSRLSTDDARVTSNTEQRTLTSDEDEVTRHVKEMEKIIVTSVINDEMVITRDSN